MSRTGEHTWGSMGEFPEKIDMLDGIWEGKVVFSVDST